MQNLSVATQRKIFQLERRVFKLEQQIARMKAKYEKEISALKAENQKLTTQPTFMTIERQRELQERRKAALRNINI
jgi:hypothetical protein